MPAGGAPAPKEKQPMDEHQVDILFLSRQEVESLLTYADVVRAVEDAFRADGSGRMLVPSKEVMRVGPDRANCIFAMPGCLESLNASGVKWTNFYPAQPDGYPTIWAHVLVLSRMDNGMPYAILDATAITNMRTAGGHPVVAAKHLARKGDKTLGVLGCGAQGRCAVRSFDEHFDLERIIVYSATPAKLERYVRETEGTLRARWRLRRAPGTWRSAPTFCSPPPPAAPRSSGPNGCPRGAWWTPCSPLTTLSPKSAASAISGWWATGNPTALRFWSTPASAICSTRRTSTPPWGRLSAAGSPAGKMTGSGSSSPTWGWARWTSPWACIWWKKPAAWARAGPCA